MCYYSSEKSPVLGVKHRKSSCFSLKMQEIFPKKGITTGIFIGWITHSIINLYQFFTAIWFVGRLFVFLRVFCHGRRAIFLHRSPAFCCCTLLLCCCVFVCGSLFVQATGRFVVLDSFSNCIICSINSRGTRTLSQLGGSMTTMPSFSTRVPALCTDHCPSLNPCAYRSLIADLNESCRSHRLNLCSKLSTTHKQKSVLRKPALGGFLHK